MKYHEITLEVPSYTVSEWENLPEDQQERVQEMKRKLTNYRSQLNTFKLKLKE